MVLGEEILNINTCLKPQQGLDDTVNCEFLKKLDALSK